VGELLRQPIVPQQLLAGLELCLQHQQQQQQQQSKAATATSTASTVMHQSLHSAVRSTGAADFMLWLLTHCIDSDSSNEQVNEQTKNTDHDVLLYNRYCFLQ
jgi:hypothetical protein